MFEFCYICMETWNTTVTETVSPSGHRTDPTRIWAPPLISFLFSVYLELKGSGMFSLSAQSNTLYATWSSQLAFTLLVPVKMMHAWKKLQSFPLLKTLPQLSIWLAKCLLGLVSHFLFFLPLCIRILSPISPGSCWNHPSLGIPSFSSGAVLNARLVLVHEP